MVWQQKVYVVIAIITVLLNIISIGKPRKTVTPEATALSAIISGLLVWLVLSI